jgi:hypothetical protein
MQNTRRLAFTREGTEIAYEQVPIDFYDKEIFKTKTSDQKSVEEVYSQGKLVRRLKAEKAYTHITPVKTKSNAYFNVSSVKSINRESESPLVEKIRLSDGREIEFRLENGQMDIYSKKANSQSYTISKRLQEGLSYEEVLRNAERGVLNELARRELQRRTQETDSGLSSYFSHLSQRKELMSALKKARDKALLEDAAKEVRYNSLVEGVNEILEKGSPVDADALKPVQNIMALRDAEFIIDAA